MDSAGADRIRLPTAFSALLAEAATDIGLTVDWRQMSVRHDASGLHGSGLWLCKGQAGPVYVDDGKPMDVRAATTDMLCRLLVTAEVVIKDAEGDERRSRRRDVKQRAAERAAKARGAVIVLTRMIRETPAAWPESTIRQA